jgi:hypothetical protein
MILKSIRYENFKGLRDFTLPVGPGVTNVFGSNAAGKTTLFDGWLYLLFGKDSQGRADFEIKTIGPDGHVIPDIEHVVEAVIDMGGHDMTLRRVLVEKWGQRGAQRGKLLGHETKYFVDGVPKRESDYKTCIAQLIREDRFKLLTDPRWFAEGLKWQDRRALVLEMCGDVSDAEVIAADPELAELVKWLNVGRTVDDYREVLKASRTKLTKEIDECKPRIDEVHKGLPVIEGGVKREDIEGQLHILRTRRQGDQEELNALRSSGGVQDKQNQIRTVEADIETALSKSRSDIRKELDNAASDLASVQSRLAALGDDRGRCQRAIKEQQDKLAKLETRRGELLKEWAEANKPAEAEVAFKPESACYACGQPLPAEQIQDAIDKVLAATRQSKSKRLTEIDGEGKANKAERERLAGVISENTAEEARLTEQIGRRVIEAAGYQQSIADFRQCLTDVKVPEALLQQKQTLLADIERLRAGTSGADQELVDAIATLDASIAENEGTLAQLDQRDKGLKRIKELEARQKTLGGEYETVEKNLALTDLFVTTKVKLLESHINEHFTSARFKMFNPLVNGGVEECCEVVYDGVPYGSLNGAARLNVGLDIINTLAKHWGIVAPVWIDNSESVTDVQETAGQQIRLYVSENDPVLRVEG